MQRDDDDQEVELVVDGGTPFLLPFFVTDDLPTLVRGAPNETPPEKFRLALFGPPDWNERGKEWLGGTGSFKWGHRLHAGIIGQAFAKIAHAYAHAVLGPDAFEPLLNDYILATEPPFDAKHIGIYPSDGTDESLHYLDLQVVNVPFSTVPGLMHRSLYVVYLRLFAYQPSPSILVAVGWPRGSLAEGLKTMRVH